MTHLKSCVLVLSILSLSISSTAARNGGLSDAPAKPATIDEYLTRLVGFGFSGAALVARDGQVLLEKGYGLADRKRNIQSTRETAFDIGSNTKDFTKMAILQLAEKKKLDLTDPITRFFDNVPMDKAAITVEQLMDHTSGLGMYSGRDEEKVTKEEFLRRVFGAALISEPGKEDNYSNPGYGLLAAIIEKVSGQPFEKYLDERIFKPAGMTMTGYLIPKWQDGQIAHSYMEGEDRGSTFDYPHLADGISWSLRGAGGTLSTLGDMYKFHLALEGQQLLSKEFKEKLFAIDSPVTLVGGNGVHYFVYMREPATRIAILIATTDAGLRATEINRPIMSLARGREVPLPPQTVKLDGAALTKLIGTYNLPSGAELSVSVKGERLFVAGANQEGFDLLAGGRRGNPERINKMTAQVSLMLEAAARGDHALMHKAFGAAMPFEEFKPRQEKLWQQRKEKFGQFKAVTVLGTVPGQGGYVTTARLDFERGVDYSQFMWGGEGLLRGIRLSVSNPGTQFFPQSATEFISFNPTTGESISLGFKPGEKAGNFKLTVQAMSGSVSSTPSAIQKSGEAKLPDTAAGRIAEAYLKAFNSGDEKVMKEFFLNNLSKTSLANRPMEDRLKIYRQIHDDLGDLELESVGEAGNEGITVTTKAKKGGSVEFRFEVDTAEPQKLKAIRVERR